MRVVGRWRALVWEGGALGVGGGYFFDASYLCFFYFCEGAAFCHCGNGKGKRGEGEGNVAREKGGGRILRKEARRTGFLWQTISTTE